MARTDLTPQQSELKRQKELRDKGFVSGAALERQAAATEAAEVRASKAAQSQLANAPERTDLPDAEGGSRQRRSSALMPKQTAWFAMARAWFGGTAR